ncbi:winged helix-turn-helix transcriptional regulator [Pseudonocardia acaciae]|uniref:winged helix-turn-helix transcriptional regulator n=1 Tax=Pseudonocardia acaciae TaxID=551276 RepID=UPI00048B9F6C|nr:helix-turn-helix domain-containing protein [Pseudonocardia acaciae]
MLPRTYPEINCSIARTLEVVGDRWTLLVVRNALAGETRFEQFQESLGIASNVLSDRLGRLTEAGVLCQRPYHDKPVRFEYLPTRKGRDLWPVLAAMIAWGDRYHPPPHGAPRLLVHEQCGGQVAAELVCATCATAVSPDAVVSVDGPGAIA